MSYGAGDLEPIWAAQVAGNPHKTLIKAKFRQLTSATILYRCLVRRAPLLVPAGKPGGISSPVHSSILAINIQGS